MPPATISGVVPAEHLRGEDDEDRRLLHHSFEHAKTFLLKQSWCSGIAESYFGGGVGGVVAVFLFRIKPARPDVDEWLWVITGDLPSAYLVIDVSFTPVEALINYESLMRDWVRLAMKGLTSEDVIPVGVTANPENANSLSVRLGLLTSIIIPLLQARAEEANPAERWKM